MDKVISWQRSERGNLWSMINGQTASVFPSRGGFAWCIHDGTGPRYSGHMFAAEDEALAALEAELDREAATLRSCDMIDPTIDLAESAPETPPAEPFLEAMAKRHTLPDAVVESLAAGACVCLVDGKDLRSGFVRLIPCHDDQRFKYTKLESHHEGGGTYLIEPIRNELIGFYLARWRFTDLEALDWQPLPVSSKSAFLLWLKGSPK